MHNYILVSKVLHLNCANNIEQHYLVGKLDYGEMDYNTDRMQVINKLERKTAIFNVTIN